MTVEDFMVIIQHSLGIEVEVTEIQEMLRRNHKYLIHYDRKRITNNLSHEFVNSNLYVQVLNPSRLRTRLVASICSIETSLLLPITLADLRVQIWC